MTNGTPRRRARSTSDVAGVPRGRLLLLERLVVLVEHHHRGRPGIGAHAAARVPTTLAAPARAVAQSSGMRATGSPGPSQPEPEATNRAGHRSDDQDGTEGGGRDQHRVRIGGRRQADRRHPRRQRLGGEAVHLVGRHR